MAAYQRGPMLMGTVPGVIKPERRVNEFIHGEDFEAVLAKCKESNIVLILGEFNWTHTLVSGLCRASF